MKDRQIEHKVINGLLKQGYQPDKAVLEDIRKTIVRESTDKYHPYYILGLVCDYGFYLGVKGTQFEVHYRYIRKEGGRNENYNYNLNHGSTYGAYHSVYFNA